MDELGKLLKEAREKKLLSRLQISMQLGWGRGCYYNHLESGIPTGKGGNPRVPSPATLEALADALDVSYKKLALAAIERFVEHKKRLYFE